MSEMTYRPLGDSGLMVSAVGIGCNAFSRRVDLDGVRGILPEGSGHLVRAFGQAHPEAVDQVVARRVRGGGGAEGA